MHTRFNHIIPLIGFFLLLLTQVQESYATHIRAGEITAERVGTFEFCFTITLYTDNAPGNAVSDALTLNFGDGSPEVDVPSVLRQNIGNDTDINIYQVCHVFSGTGIFVVSFIEENRNAGVLNINGGNSVNTPFSVQTTIVLNPAIGQNSTPVFTIPPLDQACIGQKFFHNPGAFDVDGDSLSFEIVVPRQSPASEVPNYLSVADTTFGGMNEDMNAIPSVTMDPITGDLVWDSPGRAGEYNIAFVVREWRNGVVIGAVVRDMQILVSDCQNRRPRLEVPPDLCVTANEDTTDNSNIILETIRAVDPDGNFLIITTSDSVSSINNGIFDPRNFNEIASFTFNPSPQDSLAEGVFRWETGCEHVREEPYIVVFRTEDIPSDPMDPSLVDIQSFLIQIKGPPPQNLQAVLDERAVDLSWDRYDLTCPSCAPKLADMEIVVWRREGCVDTIFCEQEPGMLGYVELARLPATETTFRDEGPLSLGLSYSYVITVEFPGSRGGVSRASDEQCVTVPVEVPLITRASVNQTDATNGTVSVRWLRPRPDQDSLGNFFDLPVRYELLRAVGQSSSDFVLVNTQEDSIGTQLEFSFEDSGLNTLDNSYLYKVDWYSGSGTAQESRRIPSDSASTVRLTATGGENQIALTWEYNVPWSNQTDVNQGVGPHLIYRRTENVPAFQLIDSVTVGTPQYTDVGAFMGECLDPDSTYFYFVKTRGSYFNDDLPSTVRLLENDSQIDFASPTDMTPPPAPLLTLVNIDCSPLETKLCSEDITISLGNENVLYWSPERTGILCDDIAFFRLFFRGIDQAEFDFNNPIYQGSDTTFVHSNLPVLPDGSISRAGCYVLTAVDRSGNESVLSNEVCQDNCLYYVLPNIITPNGDGQNDVWRPCPQPLSVESVEASVVNRWGNTVFEHSGDIEINWDGTNQQGKELPSGIYFYEVKVRFFSILPELREQTISGWVKITRSGNNIE